MAINYSVSVKINPTDENDKKVYANAQYSTVMTLSQFAKHIADHNSKYCRADVTGVLLTMIDCLLELLLDGKRIQLGEFGTFYCSIHSKGAESVEEFSESNITGLDVNWSRGKDFEDIYKNATFTYVPRRAAQEQNKKDDKQAVQDMLDGTTTTDKDTEPGTETGDSGSGGGDGSGGGG